MTQKEELTEKKLSLIERNVALLPAYIKKLSEIRPDQYEIKETEWSLKCKQIQKLLRQKSYFLFIGKFSSGKSSFVNALMGKDLLPTNAKPTTAVVTEVVFKDDKATNGEVIYNDGHIEVKGRDEILDIIQGKTKINIGMVHHVCFSININDKDFEDSKDFFRPLVDNVVLVDCPGFDSPYKFSEEILNEYIEKASFTYYFLPAVGFGDMTEIKRLRNIRKKTSTLIPLISKSDLIEDIDQRNEIIENFESALSESFPNKEPIFVSTFKFKEYQQKHKEWEDKIVANTISDDEQNVLNDLEIQAGIYKVSEEVSSDAKQEALNEKKIDSVKFEFNEIVKQILDSMRKEENYWNKELVKMNYDFESKEYKDLVNANTSIKDWINNEASEASKNVKNNIVIEVTNHLNETSGRPDEKKIKSIYNESFRKLFENNTPKWAKKYNEYFKQVSCNFNNTTEFEPPKIDFGFSGSYIWDGILLGVSDSKESLFWGVGGASLIGFQSVIAGLTLIGSVLAPIAVAAGWICLGLATVKGFNPIKKRIKEAKENRLRDIQIKVDNLLDKSTNFEAIISKLLNDHREKVYDQAVRNRKNDMNVSLTNYEECKESREKLETLWDNLNDKIQ